MRIGFWILILGFIVSGCGERIESTSYYYSPSWTKGGSVIFTYGLESVRKDLIGSQVGSSYTESVMTMTSAGANETFLFDATGAPPYSTTCSPTTEYMAYMGNLNSGLFGKIVVRNISSTSPHTGLEKVELLFSPGIKSFDWSNDGTKLVYCTTQEVRTVLVSGSGDTLVTAESNLEFVSWKYGTKIAFVHTSGSSKILELINSDGTGRLPLSAAASVDKPQISSANTSEVYGIAGGRYCKVNTGASSPATAEVRANFGGELPRLSPAADKVIYSKTGEESGIYLLDVSTGTESKIK